MKKLLTYPPDEDLWNLCEVPNCEHIVEITFGDLSLTYCPRAMAGEDPHYAGLPGFLVTELAYQDNDGIEWHKHLLTGCFDLSCDLDICHMQFLRQDPKLENGYLNYPALKDLAAVFLHLHSRSNN